MLEVHDLTISYGDFTALKDVSFDINAGEIVGLIGPNGAGKTSLIKALTGHVIPRHCAVTLDGSVITRDMSRHDLIGLVPQDIGLYSHLTAQENLDTFARIAGLTGKTRKHAVVDALNKVGLSAKSNNRVDALSGGMKRRVNVAAAIMHKPKLLILDEPTAGVDEPSRDAIYDVIQNLANEGLAILLVTHDLDYIEDICDKILFLNAGKKLIFDTPRKALETSFGDKRHLHIRFSLPPSRGMVQTLKDFGLVPSDRDTEWISTASLQSVIQTETLATALGKGSSTIQELTIHKPGLAALMTYVEKTGELPC